MKALRMKISGIVQGVWFRASTKEQAERYGVSGWVRNVMDGSVEVHAQGDEQAVEKLYQWCRRGPSGAVVESIVAEDVKVEPETRGFVIRR